MVGPSREYISSIIGWETTPPERGQRYTLSLGQGRILRTSPVQEIQEIKGGMLIRTLNSTYRIEYLE
jgi:Uma2 family endonuclease